MSPVAVQAEIDLIRKTATESAQATSKGGPAGAKSYAAVATPDARWLPPDAPAIRGREAIAEYAAAFTQMKNFEVTWDHDHVVVAETGDIAYSVGTYNGSGEDDEGATQIFEGKLVNIWHKQDDGSWKIAVAIWNTNDPETPR